MRRSVLGIVFVALVALALAPSVSGQSLSWWKSEQFQKDLGLTADQATRIEAVFETSLPKLRQNKEELDQQEAELSRLISADAGEAQVVKQVDRVEAIRAHLNKLRTLMLVHMRQVLTPEQRTKLNALHDQWERDHRRPGDGGRPRF